MSLPVEVPPSRQWIVLPARNFAPPSDMKAFVERSVASGLRRMTAANGARLEGVQLRGLARAAADQGRPHEGREARELAHGRLQYLLIPLATGDVALGGVEQVLAD